MRSFSGGQIINNALKSAKHVVVVGAGFLGLDMAFIAKQRGVKVTLVCPQAILRRIFTPAMSEMYRAFFVKNGVHVIMGVRCTNILVRDAVVVGVRLADGVELDSDMVVVACGVQPNIDLVRGQVQLEKETPTPGILVDPYLLTSVPGVFAVGDVAAMRYAQHDPGAIRHSSNARRSGGLVAESLLKVIQASDARRGSKVPASKSKEIEDAWGDQEHSLSNILRPELGLRPYVPHPSYDLEHFGFSGYVTGDRVGPDFVMIGTSMSVDEKMLTIWLWENRIVGAFVSSPTEEERALLDEATEDQWLIQGVPWLRECRDAREALQHIRNNYVL